MNVSFLVIILGKTFFLHVLFRILTQPRFCFCVTPHFNIKKKHFFGFILNLQVLFTLVTFRVVKISVP